MRFLSIVAAVSSYRVLCKMPCQLPAKLCRKLRRIDALPIGYSWISKGRKERELPDYLTKGVSSAPHGSEQRYADMLAFIERQEKLIAIAVDAAVANGQDRETAEREITANATPLSNADLASVLAAKFPSVFGEGSDFERGNDGNLVVVHATRKGSAKPERELVE